jgi:hypothetical protein
MNGILNYFIKLNTTINKQKLKWYKAAKGLCSKVEGGSRFKVKNMGQHWLGHVQGATTS